MQVRLFIIMPVAGAVTGYALGLFGFVQAEEGGVDDFLVVNRGGAGEGLGFVTAVRAVADRVGVFGQTCSSPTTG